MFLSNLQTFYDSSTNGTYLHVLPATMVQPYFAPTALNTPLDLRTINRCCRLGAYAPHSPDQANFSDSASQTSDNVEPMAKRRRLSMQSKHESVPRPMLKHRINMPMEMSPAGFIQQAFAPTLGVLPESTAMEMTDSETKKAFNRLLQYNENMVRKFPPKQRTAKEQERRNRNTLACRISRCREKVKSIAIEEQHKMFAQKYIELTEETMKKAAYLNELLKFGASIAANELNNHITDKIAKKLNLMFLANIPTTKHEATTSASKQGKRSFSMAFLMGSK